MSFIVLYSMWNLIINSLTCQKYIQGTSFNTIWIFFYEIELDALIRQSCACNISTKKLRVQPEVGS